jgi:hypothetical protein
MDRINWVWCPTCNRRVLRVHPSTGELEVAPSARTDGDYRGPLGQMTVVCPKRHRFRVSEGLRR